MRLCLCSLFVQLLFLISVKINAQIRLRDFGAGKVVVRQYAFGPGVVPAFPVRPRDTGQLSMQYVWYVKGDKIFRDNPPFAVSDTSATANAEIFVQILQPRYLINRATQITYLYSPENDRIGIIPSIANTQEPFYNRYGGNEDDKLTLLQQADSFIVAGKTCFPGTLEKNGHIIRFLYAKDSLPLKSPFNEWFPASFVYPVMAFCAAINWTNEHGQPDTGTTIFQIHNFDGEIPDNKWFVLPDSLPAVRIGELHEFYLLSK